MDKSKKKPIEEVNQNLLLLLKKINFIEKDLLFIKNQLNNNQKDNNLISKDLLEKLEKKKIKNINNEISNGWFFS